jgi:hypothetical protein
MQPGSWRWIHLAELCSPIAVVAQRRAEQWSGNTALFAACPNLAAARPRHRRRNSRFAVNIIGHFRRCHATAETQLRVLQRRSRSRLNHSPHLHVRMHLLLELRRNTRRQLPQLRRRTRPPPSAPCGQVDQISLVIRACVQTRRMSAKSELSAADAARRPNSACWSRRTAFGG